MLLNAFTFPHNTWVLPSFLERGCWGPRVCAEKQKGPRQGSPALPPDRAPMTTVLAELSHPGHCSPSPAPGRTGLGKASMVASPVFYQCLSPTCSPPVWSAQRHGLGRGQNSGPGFGVGAVQSVGKEICTVWIALTLSSHLCSSGS